MNSKKTIKTSILFLVCIYICLALFPIASSAHAYIVNSNPKENEVFSKSPTKIDIEFNEPIQSGFHSLELINSSGKQTKLNAKIKEMTILEANIKDTLPKGTYALQWKAVSADGHPVQGVIPFSIGSVQDGSVMMLAKNSSYMPNIDMIVLRWILYVSFAIYIGVAVFHLLINKELGNPNISRSTFFIWISLIGMFLAIVLNLPLQTRINAGVSWLDAFDLSLLKETLGQTSFGVIWIIQLLLLLMLIIFTLIVIKKKSFSSWNKWIVPLLLLVGLLISKSFIGHAASSNHKFIALVMNFLHLFAGSLWLGSLFSMVFLIPKKDKQNENNPYWKAIQTVSLLAICSVLIILLTGVYESFSYIPTIYSLLHTDYGIALLVKIILFFVMLVFGAFHFRKGKKHAGKRVTATIGIELIVGLMVLIAAAFLTNLPPASSTPGPFHQTQNIDHGYAATLKISPNKEGINAFTFDLEKNGKPVEDIEQITLTFTHLDMDMGKSSTNMSKKSSGEYEAKGMFFSMSGKWNVQVHILTKSLESIDINYQPNVGIQ
ncbi:copper resistance CopC/CopD family protein [Heyndrickxia sporothermodurans]